MLGYFTDASQNFDDRAIRLTLMYLRSYTGANILRDCEDYFQRYCEMASCFEDLRNFLETLGPKDAREFLASSELYLRRQSSPNLLFKKVCFDEALCITTSSD